MSGSEWTAVGVTVFGLLLGVYNLRSQNRSAKSIAEPQTAIDGFDRLTKHLESQYERSQAQIRDLYARVDELSADVERYRKDAIAWRKQLRLAVSYVKQLLAALTAANITHPTPPDGLDLQ